MAMQTFVNLPVKDLKRAREFFTSVGFSFDDQFTDENATRMIVRRYQELECWRLANQVKREVYAIIARPRSRKISNFAIKFASQRGLGRATSPKDLVDSVQPKTHVFANSRRALWLRPTITFSMRWISSTSPKTSGRS